MAAFRSWVELRAPDAEAAWWIRKSAVEHYAEHLERLVAWADALIRQRGDEV